MAKKRTKKKLDEKLDNYKVTVKILGKFYQNEASTLEDAILGLKIPNAKGISVWTMEHLGKKIERVLQGALTMRLFSLNGLAKEVALKQLVTRFI